MKNYLFFTLLAFVYIRPTNAQNHLQDQLIVALTNPGKPGILDINLVYGSIHITGYTGQEVIVDAVSLNASDSRGAGHADSGLRKVTKGNPLGLSAEEENNQIKIKTNSSVSPVNLTVKVPHRISLKLRTYDRGEITVNNVIGDLEVENLGGPINLVNIGGSVVANTYKGLIKASLQLSQSIKPMAFTSIGGRIDITYPALVKASLKVKSQQGDVFSDIDLGKGSTKTIRSVEPGRTYSSLDDWLYGKLNGGGPIIMINSYLGDIYLKKAE